MADDARSLLLQMMAAQGEGGAGAPSAAELLSGLGGDDPMLGLLARAMGSREEEEPEEEPDDERDDAALERAMTSLGGEESAGSAELERLRARLDRLLEERALHSERNATLAAALGACPDCWGADSACDRCRGEGGPGAFVPHPELFREIVLPAARRWKARAGTTTHDGRASRGEMA